MGFGTFIREHRNRLGLTLTDLACATVISIAYLSRIERERENAPKDELVRKLSAILGLPDDAVFAAARRLPPDLKDHAGEVFAAYRRASR